MKAAVRQERGLDRGRRGLAPDKRQKRNGHQSTMESMAPTISLDEETKEMLQRLGQKGETYDDIIRRLIEDAAWANLDDRWNEILQSDEFIALDEL